MIVEPHCHFQPYKAPGLKKGIELTRIAKSLGIGCMILTEHADKHNPYEFWTQDRLDEVKHEAGAEDMVMLVGEEVNTVMGHMLVYGATEHVPEKLDLDGILAFRERNHNAFTVWAHPCRRGECIVDRLEDDNVWRYCDTVEILNRSYGAKAYMLSLKIFGEHSVGYVSGSDIHLNRHVGACPMYCAHDVRTIDDYETQVCNCETTIMYKWKDMK